MGSSNLLAKEYNTRTFVYHYLDIKWKRCSSLKSSFTAVCFPTGNSANFAGYCWTMGIYLLAGWFHDQYYCCLFDILVHTWQLRILYLTTMFKLKLFNCRRLRKRFGLDDVFSGEDPYWCTFPRTGKRWFYHQLPARNWYDTMCWINMPDIWLCNVLL